MLFYFDFYSLKDKIFILESINFITNKYLDYLIKF